MSPKEVSHHNTWMLEKGGCVHTYKRAIFSKRTSPLLYAITNLDLSHVARDYSTFVMT